MTIRLHNVDKWQQLEPGKVLQMPGDRHHRVRLNLNTEAPASIKLIDAGGRVFFLGAVTGQDVIEYAWTGPHELVATSDGEVWFHTDHGSATGVERPEAVSFVKMMTRRQVNPEFKRLMWLQEQRFRQMLAQQNREMIAYQEARGNRVDPETGEVTDGEKPNDADRGSEGKKQPGSASGGSGGGSGGESEGQAPAAGAGADKRAAASDGV